MLTVKLNGGAGNQLFQVATAYALAKDHNDTCAFDFSMSPVHQGFSPVVYRENIYSKLTELPPTWKPMYAYKEPRSAYSPITYRGNMMLIGYFADEKYFAHRKKEVIDLFKNTDVLDRLRTELADKLKNSVSLHVRRGDYLKFPKVYVSLQEEYYKKALGAIESKAQIDNILVFSDDIRWCYANMHDPRITFMWWQPDYLDLYTMSLCNHNIIANSSFSWWGTYLNEAPGKIVCAPKEWFLSEGPIDASYLFCNNWILI